MNDQILSAEVEAELAAMRAIAEVLEPLHPLRRQWVIDCLCSKLTVDQQIMIEQQATDHARAGEQP